MTDSPDIKQNLISFIEEVFTLRFGAEGAKPGEGPSEVLARLLEIRNRIDRVEELLIRSLRVKARVHRLNASVQATVDDEWDQAVSATRSSPSLRGSDMVGPRERYAEANLTTLSSRREARKVADLASYADEAVDTIRVALRGLGDVRQDLNTVLRALQFESSLER